MSVTFDDASLTVEIAFADDPYTATPTWTDVTAYLRTLETRRGRSHELDTVAAGTADFTFDNRDGRFDPTYTSGAYYPNVKPMKQVRVSAVYNSTTYRLWRGFVQTMPQQWPGHSDAVAVMGAVDGFFPLNHVYTETAEVQETSGTRIGNLLDDAGWPATWRDIATGDVTVQAYTPQCSPVLSLVRKVEETEAGMFFISGDGKATFQERSYRTSPISSATFGGDTGELHYVDLVADYDDSQIWNRIEVSRYGGGTVAAEDTTSQSTYLKRVLKRYDLLHTSDADSTTLASTLLARYKDPYLRVDQITLMPQSDPSGLWPQALGLELSDYVTVKRRPPAGNTISVGVYVEGMTHRVDAAEHLWKTTLQLSQYS